MDKSKILILIIFALVIIIFLYVANLILPIWDDVWKSLVAGIVIGLAAGFWGGHKWRDLDYKEKGK